MSANDNDFPVPDDTQQETLGEAFADYLNLVDETIRTQVTSDDIRARIRHAMDQAASGQDGRRDQPRVQPGIHDQHGGTGQPSNTGEHLPGEGTRLPRLKDLGGTRHPRGLSELRNRRVQLDALIALLHDPQQGPAVLAGQGGSGKTTLAAALADHAQARGDLVWWISAANPVTLSQGLTTAAGQLGGVSDVEAIARGAADAADRFWRLLGNVGSSWLLVFDEADDPRVLAAAGSPAGVQDLTGWVRSSERGLALVTSRETDPRMWGAARLLEVGELTEADAAQVLLELAPSAGDEEQARALARRLSGHPLSLRLAGSYLHSRAARGTTFTTYEQAIGEEEHAGSQGRGRRAVATAEARMARAVRLSLDGLARQGIPQSRPVLQLASCYAPTTIPASLLNADSLTGLLGGSGGSSSTARRRAEEALRELEDIGILEPTEAGVALHTAITEAGRASLGGQDPSSAQVRHAAIRLLHDSAARLPIDQPGAWPQYLLLSPHLLSLLETTADRVDREHLGLLMETTARTVNAFNHKRAIQAGSVLSERALAHSAALASEHRAVLRVRHQMAWAMAYCGDLDEAEALYRDVFQIRLRVFGSEDQDVLFSRHELAWLAACRQDWAEAEKGYRETVSDSIRVLDPDDPQVMLTRHELAWTIANQDQGRLGEAREIFRAVLADRRRVLGAEHPRTLTTLHELAWITARQGEWEKAEASYRDLLTLRLEILGDDHPETLLTRHELAWIAARRGRTTEAESRYSDVLNDHRRILGEDHPQTLATQNALEELRRGRIIDARHLA